MIITSHFPDKYTISIRVQIRMRGLPFLSRDISETRRDWCPASIPFSSMGRTANDDGLIAARRSVAREFDR